MGRANPSAANTAGTRRSWLWRLRAAAVVGAWLSGCGEQAPAPPTSSAPADVPGVPHPPVDPLFAGIPEIPSEATAAQVSGVLRAALEDGKDLRFAVPALRRLVQAHDGQGTDATGRRPLSVSVLAGAVAMRAADGAREAVEGPEPDAAGARRLLDVGTAALQAADAADAPEAADLARARAWVELAGPPFHADRVGLSGAERTDAYVLVVTDDFELGEVLLSSVLRRWAKGAPVLVVARLTGHVRAGMRRERAAAEAETASMRKRIAAIGAVSAGVLPEDDPRVEASGLAPGTAIFVVKAGPALLARAAGRILDPRVLDDPVRATFPNVPPAPK